MDDLFTAAASSALKAAGASVYTVSRQPLDANGQPDGDAAVCGKILGRAYRQRRVGGLAIDLPGITISNQSAPLMMCMTLSGDAPKVGDVISKGGRSAAVVDAQSVRGPLRALTLNQDLEG